MLRDHKELSEKHNSPMGQKVVVNLDSKSINGYLLHIDFLKRIVRVKPIGVERSEVLEIEFNNMQSIYYVHKFENKLPQVHIDSNIWERFFTRRVSGTVHYKWDQRKWRISFARNHNAYGGIFIVYSDSSNLRQVFFPFPESSPESSSVQQARKGSINEMTVGEELASPGKLRPGHQEPAGQCAQGDGESLIEEAGVQPRSIGHAFKKQRIKSDQKIGEILIAAGAITPDQLEDALAEQKQHPSKRLGEILIAMGVATEDMIALCVALKFGLPYIDLQDYPVDGEALQCVPQEVAQKLHVFPIKLKDTELTVAFSDPTSFDPRQDLAFYTGKRIKEVIASSTSIFQAIAENYGTSPTLSGRCPADEAAVEKAAEKALSFLENDTKIEKGNRKVSKQKKEEAEIEKASSADVDEYDINEVSGQEKPIIDLVNQLIHTAVTKKASDLHIVPEKRRLKVELRIDGVLHEELILDKDCLPSIIARMKIMGDMNIAERRLPQDGRAKVRMGEKAVDLRFSCLPTIFGESMVIRILDTESGVKSLDELGILEEDLEKIRWSHQRPYGMILVTGPTGSGKSSTIYACLQEPVFAKKNVLTLEDPVEYELNGLTQIQIKDGIGLTFARSLRQVLRHDPDVIFVGEIRDFDTAKIAVQAALTGHLLFSTLHTNTAAESFVRLSQMGVEPYLISSSIVGIIAQRLIRKVCPACKEVDESAREKLEAGNYPVKPLQEAVFSLGAGCSECNQTGYQGRTVIYEYLVSDERIKQAVIKGQGVSEIRSLAEQRGMRTMERVALQKAERGETSVDEIIPLVTALSDREE